MIVFTPAHCTCPLLAYQQQEEGGDDDKRLQQITYSWSEKRSDHDEDEEVQYICIDEQQSTTVTRIL